MNPDLLRDSAAPAAIAAHLQQFLPQPAVRRRYGVTDMTLHRWANADIGWPEPIYISGRRYWRVVDLEMFERRCAANAARDSAASKRGRKRNAQSPAA